MVKLLLENGANTNDKHSDASRTALHEATFWGLVSSIYLLILQIRSEIAFYIVFNFAGHVDAVKVLIEHAANVNARDKFKLTPLHFASSNGNYRNSQLLVQNGANIGAQNKDNRTPLHDAIRNGIISSTLFSNI